ncbi:hypothetical protein BT96DRAFT_977210 [Gymnopus androsaceus JB14]|uniref:Protein kinase domain-containing protein n=1 Tax=Gymnopus androsaceus JB14 TaxID=1447944 RepID=A0A6A4HIL5_9AGAR|nr:hypothetical protein BT96DRAFT_977210 [Gymnopus androsaceus JB14]
MDINFGRLIMYDLGLFLLQDGIMVWLMVFCTPLPGLLSSAQKVGGGPGAVLGLGGLATPRKILWPARHDHGDVVIRVISPRRRREIVLQDIVLGVFPRVTASLADTFEPTTLPFMLERDMLEIFAQCLEHVTFSSFLIDSPPLSDSQSRPLTGQFRVYITNFDYAVSFPANTLPVDRFCFGEQFFTSTVDSGSDSKRSQLMLKAPEITDIGHPFSPFPVDCWQFAMSALMLGLDSASKLGEGFFANEAVLELLHTMADDDPTCRPSTLDALTSLQNILCLN